MSFEDRARAYVEQLFEVSSKNTKIDELPDHYDPLQEIEEDDQEFNLVDIMSKAVDPRTGIPRDIKIPEGDFPEAKNYFDFCENYMGPDTRFPFTRQMWICVHVLSEYCPHCSHPRWAEVLKTPIGFDARNLRDKVQFLNYGRCPKCKRKKKDMVAAKELNLYTEMALCIGQRAGKSTLTASLSAYMLHKYLKFPKMSTVCEGIQASTPLVATFLGLRFADAYGLLWEPISKNINESPWFTEYHSMLDDYGKRLGIEFYRKKDIYLKYMHKNLELYPAGPSKRALRGRTRWLSATDELGWWPIGGDNKDRERADGEEVYKAIDRSLLTVRREIRTLYKKGYSNFLMPLNINVSSPSDQADMINRLVEKNQGSTRCLALRLPTWEVTPLFPRDNEEIAQAFQDDPIAAERDYGANPPLNSAQFIDKSIAVRSFVGVQRAVAQVERANINDEWKRYGSILLSNPPQPCPASVLSIDAGYSNNSFAATVLYLSQVKVGEGVETTLHVPVTIEIQPAKGETLHYTRIYKHVLAPLIKAFNVRFFFADRWNSIALLDRAADEFQGVQLVAKQYSVKYTDFTTARSYLEDSRIILPKLEIDMDLVTRVDKYPEYFDGKPAAHLLFQMATVKDMGSTVVKGGHYTDDIFRALVLGISRITDPKIMPLILEMSAQVTRAKIMGAITAGRSIPFGGAVAAHRQAAQRATALLTHSTVAPDIGGQPDQSQHRNSNVVRVSR